MNDDAQTRTLWGVATAFVVFGALFPVVWLVSLSLKKSADLSDGQFLPSAPSLANFTGIFDNADFLAALRNSLGIALIATLLAVLVGALAAYALARLTFPGKTFIYAASLAVAMFPPIATVGPIFNIWRSVGLYDTWLGLIIPYLTFGLPLAIFTLTAFFRELPVELEQSAQVDGATPFQAFRKAVLPLAAPGVFTTAILVFIFAWNDFLFSISLTSTAASRTVPAQLAFFTGDSQFSDPTGPIAAAAVVVTIPIAILVLVFQRRIVAGLTAGAVKG